MWSRVVVLIAAWLGVVGTVAPSYAEIRPLPNAAPSTAAPRTAGIGVGESFTVEPPSARYMSELDPRERREQGRDWAVLATVARLGVTPEELAAATYELPPARLPYLDELYAFEYGRGRRAYVKGRVLLFRDHDDPDPQATVGRLADRVRMENGDDFAKVEIYVVRDERFVGEIHIERGADVSHAALFSKAYGYVEGEGGTTAKLTAWLGSADDLTFAQLTKDGRLVLGGRRFAKTSTLNLTAEDVAALYQAHEELDPYKEARARIAALPAPARAAVSEVVARIEAGTFDIETSRRELETIADATSYEALGDVVEAGRQASAPVRGPGFSLDPQWLPSSTNPQRSALVDGLRRMAIDPCRDLRLLEEQAKAILRQEPDPTRRTLRGVHAGELIESSWAYSLCGQIGKRLGSELSALVHSLDGISPSALDASLVSYYQLQNRLFVGSDFEKLTALMLGMHWADARVQCARYEGLKGTEVGMTMFYTDVLAKLWESTNYGLSAPVVEVPGFLTGPRLRLPESFKANMEQNPGTRIWFGPRSGGVSRGAASGETFMFDHRFSRIFAAGNSRLRPGEETYPREDSRRTLGWWDHHYVDVADYEPQYHRLNQIMKWSLVTAALAESSTGAYLRSLEVSRTSSFAAWTRAHRSSLRFAESLPAVHQPISGRECIPIIASLPFETMGEINYISGGVSAATHSSVKRAPSLRRSEPLGQRRPVVDTLGGPGEAAGNARRAHPVRRSTSVEFQGASRAPTSGHAGPVDLGEPSLTYARAAQPNAHVIKSGKGQTAVGELTIEALPRGVAKLTWDEGPIEQGLHHNEHVPTAREITPAKMKSGKRVTPTDLIGEALPIEGSIRAANDGYLPPSGAPTSKWRAPREVTIEELDASHRGVLPGRLKAIDGALDERFRRDSQPDTSSPTGRRPRGGRPPKRECDAEGKTETKNDDCGDQQR